VNSFESLSDGYSKNLQVAPEQTRKVAEFVKYLKEKRARHSTVSAGSIMELARSTAELNSPVMPRPWDTSDALGGIPPLNSPQSTIVRSFSAPHRLDRMVLPIAREVSAGTSESSASDEQTIDVKPRRRAGSSTFESACSKSLAGDGSLKHRSDIMRQRVQQTGSQNSPTTAKTAQSVPRMLPSGIDTHMTTPDIADLPITLINKLQFFVLPHIQRSRERLK
jgi:hypothetical protein